MKQLITIALLLCSTWVWAQTVTTPPSGSKGYGTPVATPSGEILVGRSGSYTYVTRKAYTDSLISLGYTKVQVDALLSGKQNTITGAASTAVSSDFTADRVVITNGSGKLTATNLLTSQELGYVDGVTSPIQTQINGKQDTSKLASFTDISASLKGGNVIFFGDSYIAGTGASPSSNRWSTLFSKQFGATENNQGIAGATLMKRAPIDYMGAQNMVDRVSTIPAKSAANKMLVFAFGLNDMGQTAAAYTTANFKTDYATVLNYAINTRGWKPSQILIVGAYYIGSAGYSRYATITGNAAPTQSRHLAFIQATKEVAEQFGTMFIDTYRLQADNNTTLLDPDGIHPNNAGYEYIFRAATAKFENTDYLPMSGGDLRGALGFMSGYSNVPSFSDGSVSATYMNVNLNPKTNSGNVGQSFGLAPRGTGASLESGALNVRSQMVLWNTDFVATPSLQEGLLLRSAGTYYELASVASGGGTYRPITISARGQNFNTTPSIYVAPAGTVAINKNTSINTAYALDVEGNVIVNGTITATNYSPILSGQATLDFPSTPNASGETLTITVTGAAVGDAVALGLSASNTTSAYIFTAWVSAANTVSVKFINMTGAAVDPGSQLIKVRVIK